MNAVRKPSQKEQKLIEFLVRKAKDLCLSPDWMDSLYVQTTNDGGMGSLALFPNGTPKEKRLFGEEVSKFQFADTDGVDVIVFLYVDKDGNLFEVDSWKTDFSPLIDLPNDLFEKG